MEITMKIILEGPEPGQERSTVVEDKLLAQRPIILVGGQHYIFNRFDGYHLAIRFSAVEVPLEVVLPKPEPEPRKFFGSIKGEAL
jgi:hypothetical protein